MVTYKKSGWKASFNKVKNAYVLENKKREKDMREKCASQLPKNLQAEVSIAKLGKEDPLKLSP
jgi:hypothetical protein